jgi:hypothetical protein
MAHQVDMALNGLDISLHGLHALVKGLGVNLHSLARDAPLEADELQKERAAIDSRSRNSKRGFVLAVLLASASHLEEQAVRLAEERGPSRSRDAVPRAASKRRRSALLARVLFFVGGCKEDAYSLPSVRSGLGILFTLRTR